MLFKETLSKCVRYIHKKCFHVRMFVLEKVFFTTIFLNALLQLHRTSAKKAQHKATKIKFDIHRVHYKLLIKAVLIWFAPTAKVSTKFVLCDYHLYVINLKKK